MRHDGSQSKIGETGKWRVQPIHEFLPWVIKSFVVDSYIVRSLIRYAWIEPKICRNEPAIDLPSAVKINCPSCPSGMVRYNSSNCGTCSSDQFLDSEGKCRACAGSGLLPAYSYQLNSWNYFPYGISTLCWSISGAGCANDAGWQLGNDSIISGYGHEDDALLVLQLVTEGFRNMGTDGVYGRLSFEIEIRCQNPGCQVCTKHKAMVLGSPVFSRCDRRAGWLRGYGHTWRRELFYQANKPSASQRCKQIWREKSSHSAQRWVAVIMYG